MPSSKHASAAVLADLAKLDPSHRREIRRVAGTEGGSSAIGADTPVPAVDMSAKVGPHRTVPPAYTGDPPMGSGKPAADWPGTRSSVSSGLARPGRIG
jgi:hypothetical protein